MNFVIIISMVELKGTFSKEELEEKALILHQNPPSKEEGWDEITFVGKEPILEKRQDLEEER